MQGNPDGLQIRKMGNDMKKSGQLRNCPGVVALHCFFFFFFKCISFPISLLFQVKFIFFLFFSCTSFSKSFLFSSALASKKTGVLFFFLFSCTSFSISFLFSSAVTLYWPPRKQESSFSQPWKNRSGGWVSSSRTELFLYFLFHLCSADLFLNYCLIWKNSDVCTYGTSTKTLTLPTSMTLVCLHCTCEKLCTCEE